MFLLTILTWLIIIFFVGLEVILGAFFLVPSVFAVVMGVALFVIFACLSLIDSKGKRK